ncbi:hypothetical protein TREMEDRAFT_66229 [Tremella mesenterica DSM 1558]|nr:uncharacterized protein TREMEDRAFT_66229 [Tremella mesenterica DSM 1558]EIW65861.1 hypothetical protein TREMEDRAFT_66229 [Tremella mesenterica DSM 1558]
MSLVTRLLSTKAPKSTPNLPVSQQAIPLTSFHPSIAKLIKHHLRQHDTGSMVIRNPFLLHKLPRLPSHLTESPSKVEVPSPNVIVPRFSRRAQKKMVSRYPLRSLPPSPVVDANSTTTVQTPQGEVEILWDGDPTPKEHKTPYDGRRLRFKGHKFQRQRSQREKELSDRMAGMDKLVADWRKTSAETKSSTRSQLPF